MSGLLEILKCILCCADEDIGISHDRTSFRYSSIDEPHTITQTRNYPQRSFSSFLSSPLIDSSRNESSWPSRPSPVPVEYRVVIGSETNQGTSMGSPDLQSVESIRQWLQNSRNSDSYNIHIKPPQSSGKPILRPPSPPPSMKTSSLPKRPVPSKPSITSTKPSSSSAKPSASLKPTLSFVPSSPATQRVKGTYKLVDPKDTLPIYMIPEDIEGLIKRDIVPEVLKKPLSPSTYKDYFAALLHAEDYYIEKWSDFELENATLELHPASIYEKSGENKMGDKTFVVFKVDSLSKTRRPFLLSRDFVFAKRLGKEIEPFQGVIYRVRKSTTVLVEFGDEFHSQHDSTCRYNIRFSFNRVCLKRAHQAIAAASASLIGKFLFPTISQHSLLYNHDLDRDEKSTINRILNVRGSPPFLVKGPLRATYNGNSNSFSKQLSRTGQVVKEAVLQIYQRHPESKILVCTPINSTCDVLTRSLKTEIPVSDIFRANAAFREIEGVPIDILPSCLYKRETECFSCPSLRELKEFRVIFSTFMSSYRLYNAGVPAGHFSHIFMVDASSATEPETVVALANFADESTTLIVTGAPGNRSSTVRSDIARQKGLRISYFERLCDLSSYKNGNSMFVAQLKDKA
ncbi:hypothetical protein HRI_004653100 [Hibiscus trionum]|uniref:Helicase MOV-10-like beta-barrel domain-containing protein n=1 Tax=Hibiscus trionum TaxID=183268 RepID=A0A9W7JDQ9_HIBTR|nr:hypothetical protein HRI_004653100 [Hibiscus trionum]